MSFNRINVDYDDRIWISIEDAEYIMATVYGVPVGPCGDADEDPVGPHDADEDPVGPHDEDDEDDPEEPCGPEDAPVGPSN
jgi:hypothetical protein